MFLLVLVLRCVLTVLICCKQVGQSVSTKTMMNDKLMPIAPDVALGNLRKLIARHNLTNPSVLQVWSHFT